MKAWVGLAVLLSAGTAFGKDPRATALPAALSWVQLEGTEACAPVKAVAALVDAHLGRAAFVAPGSAQLFIDAVIAARPSGGFSVRIVVRESDGTKIGARDIASESTACSAATDAAALAIALMIDPNAGAARAHVVLPLDEPERPTPTPLPVTPPSAPPTEPVCPSSPPPGRLPEAADRSRESWRARVALGGVGTWGQLPGVAPGMAVDVALSPQARRAGVELSSRYLPDRAAELATGGGGDFTASAWGAAVWLAPYRGSSVAMALKLGGQIGRIEGRGFGFTPNRSVSAWLLNLTADAELSVPLAPRWELLLGLGLGVPLRRDSFESVSSTGTRQVFRPSAVLGTAFIGVGWLP